MKNMKSSEYWANSEAAEIQTANGKRLKRRGDTAQHLHIDHDNGEADYVHEIIMSHLVANSRADSAA